MRGFTQPLAVVVGVLLCAVIGYALTSGLSHQKAQRTPVAQVKEGRRLDAPVGAGVASEEPPAQGAMRPQLPMLNSPFDSNAGTSLDGYLEMSFAKLASYQFIYPDPDDPNPPKDQIPDAIRKLDGKKIAIRGFMMPVTQKDGRVTEFLLMKDQSACCFGIWPGMNEWIHVILKEGESAPMVWDIPTTVFGTFEVGEVYEKKILMSIYRMRFDKLVEPAR